MKTSFNIAWVDDNFTDPAMDLASQLSRKIKRKNGFSLITEDVYAKVTKGDFDALLSNLTNTIDLSNSFDLILIDYELGNKTTGETIAHKFRAKLPSVDILFYSGKQSAEDLRQLIAKENVDGVYCVGRRNLAEDTYTVIENIINRSHKISTLRGLILNSVCEMDHMIREILCKYSAANIAQMDEIKNKAVQLIGHRNQAQKTTLENTPIEDLLNHKNMMSGKLFGVLEVIKSKLGLSDPQKGLLNSYRIKILDLRTTAAHAKEATCQTTGQSMLKFKDEEYKRGDIDAICKTIVSHENNIQSILDGMD
jgi:CheY-like chemotaxis protein